MCPLKKNEMMALNAISISDMDKETFENVLQNNQVLQNYC